MTYKEYMLASSKYTGAVSRKRSLTMVIRMNEAWLTNTKSVRGLKRVAAIEAAKKELAELVIPKKPKQPIGYQVFIGGCFEGFYATDDIKYVREQVIERHGHDNFKLVAAPRFRDDIID
jgi:hypothetical protein